MKIFGFCKKENDGQPRKPMGCLGKTIIGIVVYFVLCGVLGAMMGDMMSTPETVLEENTVYRLDLSGILVEQAAEEDPYTVLISKLSGQSALGSVGLNDLLSNIALAKDNDKILGIYLRGGSLAAAPASAQALRDALVDFKQSGKFVIAYADSYSQINYYIASVADKIYLNTVGNVAWDGMSAQKEYYTRLMEKIGVEMQILKVGTFKSAVEPYFRTSMSTLAVLTVSATLGGAVVGDHISPISDTTIMASTGAACNHIDHVKTQLPYALMVAGISAVAYVVAGFAASLGSVLCALIAWVVALALFAGTVFVIKFIEKKKTINQKQNG